MGRPLVIAWAPADTVAALHDRCRAEVARHALVHAAAIGEVSQPLPDDGFEHEIADRCAIAIRRQAPPHDAINRKGTHRGFLAQNRLGRRPQLASRRRDQQDVLRTRWAAMGKHVPHVAGGGLNAGIAQGLDLDDRDNHAKSV